MSQDSHHLEVTRKDLTNALRQIVRFKKKASRGQMIMLSYAYGQLKLSMSYVSIGIPASGVWNTDVLAPALSFYGLAQVPISGDPVVISVADGQLRIGGTIIEVQWAG